MSQASKKSFPFNMRHERRRRYLTLTQVSIATGIEAGNLSRIERRQQLPKPATARLLCDFYGVSYDEIYKPIFENLDALADEAEAAAAAKRFQS